MSYASLIQPVLWLVTGGTAAFFGARAALAYKRKKSFRTPLAIAAAALFAAFIIVPAIAAVPPGQRGVVYRWDGGIDQNPRGEGVSFIVPWFNHITTMSVRTQKIYSSKVYAQSADLQEITVVASINFHVDPAKSAYLYQKVGPNYGDTVIQPALFQRTKAAVGQIKAEDFALQRDNLATTIASQLTTQLKDYGIVVEYVNIEDAIFDPAFVKAVKLKIIAQQEAKRQENLIAAKAAVKQQTIINAQATARATLIKAIAQAQANKKVAASLTNALLNWRFFDTWDGTMPTTLLGSAANALNLLLQPQQ